MWKERDARFIANGSEASKESTMKDGFFKGTVENAIHKAIHSGEIIYICRGWYMFAGVE